MNFNFDNTYTSLPVELFSKVKATAAKQPQLVIFNEELADQLGLIYKNTSMEDLAQTLCGNKSPEGAANIAQAYAGHQFGHFTILGDGRALMLGEHLTPDKKRYDIQLKGSGPTPYSRRGDGKGTLSSMLREYVFSEALHALNIPTTRSLAVVATGDAVYRDPIQEGGILTRVADSHIRVGTFQYAATLGSNNTIQSLLDYTINRHYPHIQNSKTPALDLLNKVMNRQISLITHWLRVGFIHGVMNTDNMLLSGETIDYGPCAFMNHYKPGTVFSSIDVNGRYAYDQQAGIGLWNLTRLAESLLPLIDKDSAKAQSKALEVLNTYQEKFQTSFQQMLLGKIGLIESSFENLKLTERLLKWMEQYKADFTNTFIQLMYPEQKLNLCFENSLVKEWVKEWKQQAPSLELMQQNNPSYILRNHLVEESLQKMTQEGDADLFNTLLAKVQKPYAKDNFDTSFIVPPMLEFDNKYKTFCGT